MNLAQITVSGNVRQTPEIKTVGNTKVANFSIAVNENYKNKSGEKVEKTHWYPVEAWDGSNGTGLVTNVIQKYLTVGTTVLVQGMPLYESYDKDGETRKSFKIKLAGSGSTFRLMGGKKNGEASSDKASTKVDEKLDDDIPFQEVNQGLVKASPFFTEMKEEPMNQIQKILNNPDYKLISQEMDNVVHSATKLRIECNNYREQLDSLMEFVQEELINPYDGRQAGSDIYRRARDLMKKSQEVIDFHDAN